MATSSMDLNRVGQQHRLRSFRIGSGLRVGVVVLMLGAMLVGTAAHEWPKQGALIGLYAFAAAWALLLAFSPDRRSVTSQRTQLVFTGIDVVTLTGFQLLSDGGYVPLLVMGLLPILIGLEVPLRRTAVVLTFTVAGFAFSVRQDPVMDVHLGWPDKFFLFAIYAFLCCTAVLAGYVGERYANAIAGLTALREELLAQTMTASEALQREVSESLHDGPLQDVLAARLALLELAERAPGEELDHALASLKDASTRLREATFELHPAVLDLVGVGAAVEQLASSTANRSGVAIVTDIDYPVRNAIDPIVFGVVRELLSNVSRHSQATNASIKLRIADQVCRLDVADNGIGMTPEEAVRRLGEGHIGLASHRARVEAAGGRLTFVDEPVGTHIRVELPLRSEAQRAEGAIATSR
jgi:two-component system, NarL family, sensor kinase